MWTPSKATAHLCAAPGPRFTNLKCAVKVPSAGNLCATDRLLRLCPADAAGTRTYFSRMNNLLDALYALRPLWAPSLMIILAAFVGLILISI